jgi:beta-phosphoglucomutase-like phosphatase (HAD superfamily)
VVDEVLAEIVEAIPSGEFKLSLNATGNTPLVVIRLPDAIDAAKVAEGKKPAPALALEAV